MLRKFLLSCLLPSLALAQVQPGCIHLKHGSTIYSLSYPNNSCVHSEIKPLPQELYDAASGWASNSAHAKVMSEFTSFQITARLSVSDYSESHGVAHGPCTYGSWSDYGWSENADHAYLGLVDKLGMNHPLVVELRKDALRARLARKDKSFGMTFKEKKLPQSKRNQLEVIFENIESKLKSDSMATAVGLAITEKLRKEPWTKPTFSKFELVQ